MYYIGLFLTFWMIVGALYGIYLIFVSNGYEELKEFTKKEGVNRFYKKEGFHMFSNIVNSKKLFFLLCLLVGLPMFLGDVKFYISYHFRKKD